MLPARADPRGAAVSGWLRPRTCRRCCSPPAGSRAHPFATRFTVLVIAIALTLPASFALLISSVRSVSSDFANAVDVSVYFKRDVADREGAAAGCQRPRAAAASARSRSSPADAGAGAVPQGQRLRGGAGCAHRQSPAACHGRARRPRAAASPADLEALKRYLAAWPEVELVQVDTEWVLRLTRSWTCCAGRAGHRGRCWASAWSRSSATPSAWRSTTAAPRSRSSSWSAAAMRFVRRPFLYTGTALRLGWARCWRASLVWTACRLLAAAGRSASPAPTAAPSAWPALALREVADAAGGAAQVLGWLGAFLSASRHLARIEPRA